MPTNDNWKVSIVRDRTAENTWVATAKRDDFEFSQRVQGNEGEITEFCKTARTMYREHVKDQARARELEGHFDNILESEDKREADEAVIAEAKAKADAEAAKLKAEQEAAAARAKAEADAKAAEEAARAPEPVVEAPVEAPAAEPISDAAQPEDPKNETPV